MATGIPHMSRLMVQHRSYNRCARCGLTGSEWHHRRSRSVRDEHQHCPCNGVWLCRDCHSWVHAHPFEARTSGWIVSRYATPGDVPMLTQQHGWVTLGHDGTYEGVSDPRQEEGGGAT